MVRLCIKLKFLMYLIEFKEYCLWIKIGRWPFKFAPHDPRTINCPAKNTFLCPYPIFFICWSSMLMAVPAISVNGWDKAVREG